MKIRLLITMLALVASMAFIVSAAPLSREQAQQEAAAFVMQKHKSAPSLKMAARAPRQPKSVATGDAAYYIFNIGDNRGFVIVSGDDRTNPILGYSDEGYFDADKAPANLKAWLNEYALQISQLDEVEPAALNKALAAPKAARVVDTRNSIAPMVTTKWDQATPYWNKCPEFMSVEDGDTVGELAYTGCVATSMSQVMNFHKWPKQTTKEIPSYSFSIPNGDYTYSSVEMEAQPVTTFDWKHMRDSYNGSEDEVYTDAVATLMLYAGCAVKSQYGTSATGAYTDDIPTGFTEYFGYDASTIQIKFRADFSQEDWDNMVYAELAEGRPMIYNGTAGSSGGHSFVCDGYEYGNYFHINWGWGGMGNGYFQLAVLNPRESGIGGASSAEGYNMKQNIIIGIKPGNGSSGGGGEQPAVEDALTVTNLSTYGSFSRDSESEGFSIYKNKYFTLGYADHVGTQKRYDVGLAFYTTAGTFHSMIINRGTYSTALTSAVGSTEYLGKNYNARNPLKMGAGMTGTYKIVPMYKLEGSSEWKPMLESDRYYLECTMTATQATFKAHPVLGLEIQGMTFEGGEKVGSPEQIHVTLKNNSADRFFGDLYLSFGGQQIDEYSQYTTAIQAEVLADATATVTFNVTPENAGTQTLRLYYDANCSKAVTGSGSVTIAASNESTMNLAVEIEAENATGGIIYDTHAHFKVNVTNNGEGEYNKYVLAPLFLVSKDAEGNVTGGSMITYSQSALSLQPGQTKTLYFDFDNLAYGETYSLNIYARNESGTLVNIVEKGKSVYYDIKRGLVTWDGTSMTGTGVAASGKITIPASALAARLEGLDITSVTPSGNPNTIYFLGENEAVPAGLEGLNVVKGSTAASISLTDGYGYFTPQSFTAQSISYNRTFNVQRTAGVAANWSTIVLPFTPTAVTAAGKEVDWYRKASDSGKAMWLGTFATEQDGVATFDYAQSMEANVPYIIALDKTAALAGKAITWQAANVLLKPEPIAYTSGEIYLMAGTFVKKLLTTVYAVNGAGSHATWATGNQVVEPFRAYFSELSDVESHTAIPLPGTAQESNVEQLTLAQLVETGVTGNDYEITNALTVAFVSPDGKTVYAKDDNEFALRNEEPYVPSAEQTAGRKIFDDVTTMDQSNWIAINLPQALDEPEYYTGSTITAVQGTLSSVLNPEISVTAMPTFERGNGYEANVLTVANFAESNTYFFMPPKPQEYVTVRWAVYSDGKFYMPRSENGINTEKAQGVVNAKMDLYTGDDFENNYSYNFTAIVKAITPRVSKTMAAGELINVQEGEVSSFFEVYPIGMLKKDTATGIATILDNNKSSNVYYDLMGRPVTNPGAGIYIHNGKKVIVR